MKKNIVLIIVSITIVSVLSGCGQSAAQLTISLDRQKKYNKIAIVCAPKEDASPEYVSGILDQVQKMIPSRLGYFLEKVTCIEDASIDLSSSTPVVSFSGKDGYDGIVCLLYNYGNGLVTMDINMLDNGMGQEIWSHQFATEDPYVRERLYKHGYWVPTTLKMHFYNR